MQFKEIKELIQIMAAESRLDELEVERSGTRVRIRRSGPPSAAIPSVEISSAAPRAPAPPPAVPAAADDADDDSLRDDPDLIYVTSPIVGTFYRSPSPEAEPFVGVGDDVDKGTVVCIIEAMKLMNEIEAEAAGEIVSVFVESGHPVEYGQRLFALRPR